MGEFTDLTAAVVVQDDPWRVAYTTLTFWRPVWETVGWSVFTLELEAVLRSLEDRAGEEGFTFDRADVHWFVNHGFIIPTPETFQ